MRARVGDVLLVILQLLAHVGPNVEDKFVRDVALGISSVLTSRVDGNTNLHLLENGRSAKSDEGSDRTRLTRQKAASER